MNILCVDLQNEFTTQGGAHYQLRPCVSFIRDTFLPFVDKKGWTIGEIVSDYRVTGSENDSSVCVPGQWGYQSIIPDTVKHPRVWVKAEPSPVWIREGRGQAEIFPGIPYPAPDTFTEWLNETFGSPGPQNEILAITLRDAFSVLGPGCLLA